MYGTEQQIKHIKITSNHLNGASGGNGIRLLALAGSNDIDVESNTITNFKNGWHDDACDRHYDNISLINNDLRVNPKGVDHNFTGGAWIESGNIVSGIE
jgi:hypothetical protein